MINNSKQVDKIHLLDMLRGLKDFRISLSSKVIHLLIFLKSLISFSEQQKQVDRIESKEEMCLWKQKLILWMQYMEHKNKSFLVGLIYVPLVKEQELNQAQVKLNVQHVEELDLQIGIKDRFKFKKFAIIVMVRERLFEIHVKLVGVKEL